MAATAKVWNRLPSDLIGLPAGTLQSHVLDEALARRIAPEVFAAVEGDGPAAAPPPAPPLTDDDAWPDDLPLEAFPDTPAAMIGGRG